MDYGLDDDAELIRGKDLGFDVILGLIEDLKSLQFIVLLDGFVDGSSQSGRVEELLSFPQPGALMLFSSSTSLTIAFGAFSWAELRRGREGRTVWP